MTKQTTKNHLIIIELTTALAFLATACGENAVTTVSRPLEATLTSPADYAHYYEGQVLELSGQVFDRNPRGSTTLDEIDVTFLLDGREVAHANPDSEGWVALDLDLSDQGLALELEHMLEMIATRPENTNSITAEAIIVLDPNTPPSAEFLNPGPSARLYDGEMAEISFRAWDVEGRPQSLGLKLNGEELPPDDLDLSNGSSLNEVFGSDWVFLETGANQVLTLTVVDSFGKSTTISQLIDVGPRNTPPSLCGILAPTENSKLVAGEPILLEGSADDIDQEPESLSFLWYDGTSVLAHGHPTTNGSISTTLSEGLEVGTHQLTLTVTDELGAHCEEQRKIEVRAQNIPPSIEILYPVTDGAGATLNAQDTFQFNLQARDMEDSAPLPVSLSVNDLLLEGSSCTLVGQGQSDDAYTSDYSCIFPASSVGEDTGATQVVSVYARTQDSEGAAASSFVVVRVQTCAHDADADGFNNCDEPGCDDNAEINPGVPELCDGLDNNCDGVVDADASDQALYYSDDDKDGYGTIAKTTQACTPPSGYVQSGGDCDDDNTQVNPGQVEICGDGMDNDCNGLVDDSADEDEDGFSLCTGDCDDSNPDIHPDAPEACNGLDDNCDGSIDANEKDMDGDGYMACEESGCDDDSSRHPTAEELCNGLDDDCDGSIPESETLDNDSDGFVNCAEVGCEDEADRNPGLSEVCNGRDDNCDMVVDEGLDQDADGFYPCVIDGNPADCDDLDADVHPGALEQCDGVDENCDGVVDMDAEFDADEDGQAYCMGDCDDADPSSYEGAREILDGTDNDCDGESDDLLIEMVARADFYGEHNQAAAGSAVAGIGDVNNDGQPDFAVGVPRYRASNEAVEDDWYTGLGRAYVFFGGQEAPLSDTEINSSSASAWFTGQNEEDEAGRSIAGAGDLNGDGIDDFVVGAPYHRAPGASAFAGAAYIFFGCDSSDSSCDLSSELEPDVTFNGKTGMAHLGLRVAPAGDVNCDGLDDLLIAAPDRTEAEMASAGSVYLVLGKTEGWASEEGSTIFNASAAEVKFQAETENARLGMGLSASSGDMNGDGCDDVVLGAPSDYGEAAVYVLFGRADWSSSQDSEEGDDSIPSSGQIVVSVTDSDLVFTGRDSGHAGQALALTDLNGDGLDDLAIGAPDDSSNSGGMVFLLYGRESWSSSGRQGYLADAADALIQGAAQPEQAGCSLAGGRDISGDGIEDLVIGAPNWSTPDYPESTSLGRAYVFYGDESFGDELLETQDADMALAGGTPGHSDAETDPMNTAKVATAVAMIGDVYPADSDVISDFLVTTPYYDSASTDVGKVYLVEGMNLMP